MKMRFDSHRNAQSPIVVCVLTHIQTFPITIICLQLLQRLETLLKNRLDGAIENNQSVMHAWA